MSTELVISIIDGDTIMTLLRQAPIRILGYDAPEFDAIGYSEAKSTLGNLILNQFVFVEYVSTDVYKRHLCHVSYQKDGLWLDVATYMKEYLQRINIFS